MLVNFSSMFQLFVWPIMTCPCHLVLDMVVPSHPRRLAVSCRGDTQFETDAMPEADALFGVRRI